MCTVHSKSLDTSCEENIICVLVWFGLVWFGLLTSNEDLKAREQEQEKKELEIPCLDLFLAFFRVQRHFKVGTWKFLI